MPNAGIAMGVGWDLSPSALASLIGDEFMLLYINKGVDYVGLGAIHGSTASGSTHANKTAWHPFWVPESCTLSQVSAVVTTLEAGSGARVGVYSVSSLSQLGPTGTLVSDLGTMDSSGLGTKTISPALALTRGLYFIAIAHSNHGTVRWRRPDGDNNGVFGESTSSATIGGTFWGNSAGHFSAMPASVPAMAEFVAGGLSGASGYAELKARFS